MKCCNLIYCVVFLLVACNQSQKKDYELLPFEIENRWGYLDQAGKYSINPQFKIAYFFNDQLARVKDYTENKYGYINKNGKYAIPPKFVSATDFSEGIAAVAEENLKITLIDRTGKIIISLDSIDECSPFKNGYAKIKMNNSWGYINKIGEIVIRPKYLEVGDFNEGLAIAKLNNSENPFGFVKELYGFINEKGSWVIEPKYSKTSDFSNGTAKVQQNKLWGYIDKQGNWAINPQFDWATDFKDDYAAVALGEKWGFINKAGNYVINPQFDWAGNFTENLAMVKVEEKYGYINRKGEYVINPQFKEATRYYDKIAFVKEGEKYGIINEEGKIIINSQFFEASSDWLSEIGLVYNEWRMTLANKAYSDFFDCEAIVKCLLTTTDKKVFFGVSSSLTARMLLEQNSELKEGSNYLYGDGHKLNNNAEITMIKYVFKDDFIKYTDQYATKYVRGYKFQEFVGSQKTVNFDVALSKLYLEIKIDRGNKSGRLIEALKKELKKLYDIVKEESLLYEGTQLSSDQLTFSIQNSGEGKINLTVYYH